MGVKLRERKPGEWWLFIDHKGRRKAIKVGTEKAARTAAIKIEKGLTEGKVNLGPVKKVLFRDQYEKWIGQHVGMGCEESTGHIYTGIWKNHVEGYFGDTELAAINREMIREFYRVKKEEGYAKNTIRNMRNLISGVVALAIEDKIVEVNPVSRSGKYLTSAKAEKKAEFLTPDEVRLLLDTAKEKYGMFYPFFLTAARTGMRQGELIGLRWDDIDWNGKFLTVRRTIYRKTAKIPKSGKTRKVDMSDQLLSVLRDHKKAMAAGYLRKGKPFSEYVFTSSHQTTHEPSWIRKVFAKCLKEAGLRAVPFHALRHSFASALLANNAPLNYVKEQLGHHSIQVTVDVYGHLIPSANRAEVNRLDDAGSWKSATQVQPTPIHVASLLTTNG